MHALGVRRWAGREAATLALGDQGTPDRRGAHRGQRRAHPDDVRQLRRPGRDRRRGPRAWAESRRGQSEARPIDERLVETHLYLPDLADADMVWRTSGEQRLSNFMLWQAAYSEMVFTDVYWPAVDRRDLWAASRPTPAGPAATAPPDRLAEASQIQARVPPRRRRFRPGYPEGLWKPGCVVRRAGAPSAPCSATSVRRPAAARRQVPAATRRAVHPGPRARRGDHPEQLTWLCARGYLRRLVAGRVRRDAGRRLPPPARRGAAARRTPGRGDHRPHRRLAARRRDGARAGRPPAHAPRLDVRPAPWSPVAQRPGGERTTIPASRRRRRGARAAGDQPVRTACDLGPAPAPRPAFAALDSMLRLDLFDREELWDATRHLRGMRGVRQLRAFVPLADGRAESPGESITRLRWLDVGGLPAPELQIEVPGPTGWAEPARPRCRGAPLRRGVRGRGVARVTDEQREHDEERRDYIARTGGWLIRPVTKANVFGPRRDIESLILVTGSAMLGAAARWRQLRGRRYAAASRSRSRAHPWRTAGPTSCTVRMSSGRIGGGRWAYLSAASSFTVGLHASSVRRAG